MELDNFSSSESYKNHAVFKEINNISNFYKELSYTCFYFLPNGVRSKLNYASYVYTSIQGTLESVNTLLTIGRITDACTLVRKYFDDVLVEIYIDVIRKDRFDWEDNIIVKDVDEWIKNKHRIPQTKKLLSILKKSESTKDIYPFFGWNTYFDKNREWLNDSVHGNRYMSVVLNCNKLCVENKEMYLKNILIIVNQIFTMHLAFIFHLNPQYMMDPGYIDLLGQGITPIEGSETWLASYAQEAFDKYIKKHSVLSDFIKDRCCMKIE